MSRKKIAADFVSSIVRTHTSMPSADMYSALSTVADIDAEQMAAMLRLASKAVQGTESLMPAKVPYYVQVPHVLVDSAGFESVCRELLSGAMPSPSVKRLLLTVALSDSDPVAQERKLDAVAGFYVPGSSFYQADVFSLSLKRPDLFPTSTPVTPKIHEVAVRHPENGLQGGAGYAIHLIKNKFRVHANALVSGAKIVMHDNALIPDARGVWAAMAREAFLEKSLVTSTWILGLGYREEVWGYLTPQAATLSPFYSPADSDALLANMLRGVYSQFNPAMGIAEILPAEGYLRMASYWNPAVMQQHVWVMSIVTSLMAYHHAETNEFSLNSNWVKGLREMVQVRDLIGFDDGIKEPDLKLISDPEFCKCLDEEGDPEHVLSVLHQRMAHLLSELPREDIFGPIRYGADHISQDEVPPRQHMNMRMIDLSAGVM